MHRKQSIQHNINMKKSTEYSSNWFSTHDCRVGAFFLKNPKESHCLRFLAKYSIERDTVSQVAVLGAKSLSLFFECLK